VNRLYVLVPVFAAAGFLTWSATQLVRAVRQEVT
jgi:hypothetical protein